MKADIKTLIQMNIGYIKDLEKMQKDFKNTCGDIIDRQKETVNSFIEQEDIKETWAEEFIRGL